MKTQKVPKIIFPANTNIEEKIKLLKKEGAKLHVDKVNWSDFPKKIATSVTISHTEEAICLLYEIKGEKLRAENTADFESVWEDSCVEFFVQRLSEQYYYNFECNALGVLLASKRTSRENAENLQEKQMSQIVRRSSILHYYQDNEQLSDWTLFLEIPKSIIGFSDKDSLSGQACRANFYKCGDKTSEPHFLSWNPIDITEPDFHRPDFFGQIDFE